MWRKWLSDFKVELYWLKKDLTKRWHLDTPAGFAGILAIVFGVILLIIMVQGIAKLFRLFIPWISGARIGEAYWSSVGFALQASVIFLLFFSSLIFFIMLKIFKNR